MRCHQARHIITYRHSSYIKIRDYNIRSYDVWLVLVRTHSSQTQNVCYVRSLCHWNTTFQRAVTIPCVLSRFKFTTLQAVVMEAWRIWTRPVDWHLAVLKERLLFDHLKPMRIAPRLQLLWLPMVLPDTCQDHLIVYKATTAEYVIVGSSRGSTFLRHSW
jgi:hypothetical protein